MMIIALFLLRWVASLGDGEHLTELEDKMEDELNAHL